MRDYVPCGLAVTEVLPGSRFQGDEEEVLALRAKEPGCLGPIWLSFPNSDMEADFLADYAR